jgi:hypothetical protein
MLAGIERDLGLAQYEPASIRPPDSWIDGRRRAADEIGALLGPLLLTGAKDLRFSAKIVNRLSRLADGLDALDEAPSPADRGRSGAMDIAQVAE